MDSINVVDILYGDLEFLQDTNFEHELRIENLETALKNTLQILKVLVDAEFEIRERKPDSGLRRKV